jgi:hypothetical protein
MKGLPRRVFWRSVLRGSCATALVLGLAAYAPNAHAQSAPDDRMDRLIQLLIDKKILTSKQATTLMQETASPSAPRTASAKPMKAVPAEAAAPATTTVSEPPSPPGSVHVTYVPPLVRKQIAAEVKQEMQQEAQAAGGTGNTIVPEWTQRIKITGDMRLRGAESMFPHGNDNFLPNFQSINSSANGFDANNAAGTLPPFLNTTENRTQFQVRARLDVAAHVDDWIDSELRLASGNSNSPVSLNQTMGQTGDFSKYSIWLDRAAVFLHPTEGLSISVGRFANPFWTTDLEYYSDLNFDGIAGSYQHRITKSVDGFITLGAFPVFNSDFNFQSNSPVKSSSRDAYLFAAQAGASWKINEDYLAKLALAYFDYSNVRGSESSPCFNPVANGSCDTDNSKPGFIQFGNTLFPIRNIIQNPGSATSAPEFYGLASAFNILDVHGSFTLSNFHPIDITLYGEYSKNLGFNRSSIASNNPNNNLGPDNNFVGGDTGYLFGVTVGHSDLAKPWDWNVSVSYRYLESDAVLDALTDSEFHLGGTNAKGYTLKGNLAISPNAWLSATFHSANQISGPTYANDLLLIDLNAKF